jgi:hypothetical protein
MTSQNNQMTKFLIALSLSLSVSLNAVQKPNILIIIADDCTFSDLPINGGQNAKTPHLDAFAKQSLIFNRAYLGMAMCSPCRSELYTGTISSPKWLRLESRHLPSRDSKYASHFEATRDIESD